MFSSARTLESRARRDFSSLMRWVLNTVQSYFANDYELAFATIHAEIVSRYVWGLSYGHRMI